MHNTIDIEDLKPFYKLDDGKVFLACFIHKPHLTLIINVKDDINENTYFLKLKKSDKIWLLLITAVAEKVCDEDFHLYEPIIDFDCEVVGLDYSTPNLIDINLNYRTLEHLAIKGTKKALSNKNVDCKVFNVGKIRAEIKKALIDKFADLI
ncbi:hypothetical protein C0583_06050 [Candidatus Parcubacteria bacterium]|nr:MAG: hypothetical protein C0583_06050 [Candidatus Parcubacteria bacterium]